MFEKKKTENIDLNLEDIIVVYLGKDEIVADINKKGYELLEYSKNEVVGKNWFDVFVPQSIREETRLSFHQLLDGTSRKGHAEKRVLTKSGHECLVAWQTLLVK
jgi:PAS domain S-box-containing protein